MGSDADAGDVETRLDISIHAPAWGATEPKHSLNNKHNNFNPRSRMGSDRKTRTKPVPITISIHAPAWGTTNTDARRLADILISIHAPAWGATDRAQPERHEPHTDFNPRSRMGSDPCGWPSYPVFPISIHAPAWGATHRNASPRSPPHDFNPRSRMGSDPCRR